MTFTDFQTVLSQPRLQRYLQACRNDPRRALKLYRRNILLCKEMYGVLGIFEVALRNAVQQHYAAQFADSDWLFSECQTGGFLSHPRLTVTGFKTRNTILATAADLSTRRTPDRLVASVSFGVWVHLFAPIQFQTGGQTLHHIFPSRTHGTTPRQIFSDLSKIMFFRNRVAHHEPVCFDAAHQIDTNYARNIYQNLIEKTIWLGLKPAQLFYGVDRVQLALAEIDGLQIPRRTVSGV